MYRIAIDYTAAHEQTGGIGRYVRELTAALASIDQSNAYRLFVAGASPAELPRPPASNFRWSATTITPRWLSRIWHRARLPLPVELFTGNIDLFHATDFVLPPTLPQTRTVLTVHDLSFVHVPNSASPALKAYLDRVVPRSVQKADRILADSQATKQDLIQLYGIDASKISVLLCGVDEHFKPVSEPHEIERIRRKYGLTGKDYILSVGTVQPRKNYSRVIEALAEIRAHGHELHYVIAGGEGWLEDEMHHTIARRDLADYVQLLGYVDDADLPALYSAAQALVMVSLYEGFGLPVLEAMACGTPVITSNLSSLPEVAGEAALMVDPYDVPAIQDAILRLQNSTERQRLIAAGYSQVKQFNWKRSAAQLKSIYDELLES